jgi:hypothetical protein
MYIVLKKTGRKAGLWWVQINCISTANVRILCLSFNANKTTTTTTKTANFSLKEHKQGS